MSPSPQANKARVLELFERVMNGHNADAIHDYTANPSIIGSATHQLQAFPDLEVSVRWIVAEGDRVVVFQDFRGTQQGPWLFVEQPTRRKVTTSFVLTFEFDEDGQIIDQWLGSNFIDILAQLGWGFAPAGEVVAQV